MQYWTEHLGTAVEHEAFFGCWDLGRKRHLETDVLKPQRHRHKFLFHPLTSCVIFNMLVEKKKNLGTSLTVQWLVRTQWFHRQDPGSVSGWGTKIPQATQCSKKKKRKKQQNSPCLNFSVCKKKLIVTTLQGGIWGFQKIYLRPNLCLAYNEYAYLYNEHIFCF